MGLKDGKEGMTFFFFSVVIRPTLICPRDWCAFIWVVFSRCFRMRKGNNVWWNRRRVVYSNEMETTATWQIVWRSMYWFRRMLLDMLRALCLLSMYRMLSRDSTKHRADFIWRVCVMLFIIEYKDSLFTRHINVNRANIPRFLREFGMIFVVCNMSNGSPEPALFNTIRMCICSFVGDVRVASKPKVTIPCKDVTRESEYQTRFEKKRAHFGTKRSIHLFARNFAMKIF